MTKVHVEYKKNGKNFSASVDQNEIKRLLKNVVKIQICTKQESFEIEDSISNFLKKYKKYGVKNLSEKYNTSKVNILNKLMSLGMSN